MRRSPREVAYDFGSRRLLPEGLHSSPLRRYFFRLFEPRQRDVLHRGQPLHVLGVEAHELIELVGKALARRKSEVPRNLEGDRKVVGPPAFGQGMDKF